MPPVLGPVLGTDVYRVTFFQRLYGQRVMNVLHYKVTDAGITPPDKWDYMLSLADSFTGAGGIVARMVAMQTEDLAFENIRVSFQSLPGETTLPYADQLVVTPGSVAGPAGTANVAMSIEKRSTFAPNLPRQGIGRFQLGGIPQDRYEAGLFKDAYMADASDLAAALSDTIVTAGVTAAPAIYGEFEGTAHVNLIFGVTPKITVRDMRRRTVGVGE